MKPYLIVVDVQNDFLPGGALAVPDGNEVVEPINRLIDTFGERAVFTRDSHPEHHRSFASYYLGFEPFDQLPNGEIAWPDHCVSMSGGEDFPEGLHWTNDYLVVCKGMDSVLDSYSGFFEGGRKPSRLPEILRSAQADTVVVCGLATDYCVKATALDAIRQGFKTWVAIDACRGVGAKPGDIQNAYIEMVQSDVRLIGVDEICNPTGMQILEENIGRINR